MLNNLTTSGCQKTHPKMKTGKDVLARSLQADLIN
jgi:hypothetical protein